MTTMPSIPQASEHAAATGPVASMLLRHVLLWAFLAIVLSLGWTGFLASDDENYIRGALGWLNGFPYVPSYFGTSRFVTSMPMAAAMAAFGQSEWVVALPTCIYFCLVVSLTLEMLRGIIGLRAAIISSLLLGTLPLLVIRSTIASTDLPELLFVALSVWLYAGTRESNRPALRMMLAGTSLGFAFSAHELSLAAFLYFGLAYLFRPIVERRHYWMILVGFGVVVGLECLYYAVYAGDPLHRYNLLRKAIRLVDRVQVGVGEFAADGTLHIWDPIDPVIMFLTKHEFSLLGFFAIPALWWTCRPTHEAYGRAQAYARIFAGLAGVWMVFTAIMLRDMILSPRYYMVAGYCLFIVMSIWASTALWRRRKRLVLAGGLAFLGLSVLAICVDNRNPRFGERTLVTLLKSQPGELFTDPLTQDDIHRFCVWESMDCSRVRPGSPPAGALYYYNPKNTSKPNRLNKADQLAGLRPLAAWELLQTFEEEPKLLGRVLDRFGVLQMLPARLANKLMRPNPSTALYRVPVAYAATAAAAPEASPPPMRPGLQASPP